MNKITASLVLSLIVISASIQCSTAGATSGVEGGTAQGTPVNQQPSVKNGADDSKSGNGMAQALNYLVGGGEVVMGGYMIKTGIAKNSPPCECGMPDILMGSMMVAMGLQNIAQGNEHGNSAGQAGLTSFQTDGFGGLSNPDTSLNTPNPAVEAAKNDSNYKAVGSTLKALEAAKVYNPKAGTFQVGDKTYKQSDFASKEAMAAAGFPQGMIDGAMSANAEAEKKALAKLDKVKAGAATAENGYAEGGGGGGGGWGAGSGADDGSSGIAGAGGAGHLGKKGFERDPSSLAGMSKNYNGEPIGVAADSIFLMMSRRYKVKESQESFFSPSDLALQK